MKLSILFFVCSFVSCSFFRETVGYQKFPIPKGKKVLLVPTVSSFYSDHHSLQKEVVFQIIEAFERNGYQVIERDERHEFKGYPDVNDHFATLQMKLTPTEGKNESKVTYWIEIATGLEIPYVVFVRFPKSAKNEIISIRLVWMHLLKGESEQFDWDWNPLSPLPIFGNKEKG